MAKPTHSKTKFEQQARKLRVEMAARKKANKMTDAVRKRMKERDDLQAQYAAEQEEELLKTSTEGERIDVVFRKLLKAMLEDVKHFNKTTASDGLSDSVKERKLMLGVIKEELTVLREMRNLRKTIIEDDKRRMLPIVTSKSNTEEDRNIALIKQAKKKMKGMGLNFDTE